MKVNKLKKTNKKINMFSIFRSAAVFILVFTIAIAVYIYAYSHPIKSIMPIKNIVFIGNRHLTDDELRVLTGIRVNESLITVSNKKVSRRLLKSPWIKSVNVGKELPDTLAFIIEEVVPFALLDMNGHLILIDEKGRLLEELKDNSIPFLPVINGDPFKENKGFSEALKLARLINEKRFLSQRDQLKIIARKPNELTVIIDDTIVKIGSGGFEEKLQRLIELEDEIKKRGIIIDYIDLRFAHKAIVKPVTNKVIK